VNTPADPALSPHASTRAGTGWPTVADLSARIGVPWNSNDDEADATAALDAAREWVEYHSTVWHYEQARGLTDPGARVHRGTLDLAVALYERRGSTVDPFDGLPVGMMTHYQRLLGVGRFALPTITGGSL